MYVYNNNNHITKVPIFNSVANLAFHLAKGL